MTTYTEASGSSALYLKGGAGTIWDAATDGNGSYTETLWDVIDNVNTTVWDYVPVVYSSASNNSVTYNEV